MFASGLADIGQQGDIVEIPFPPSVIQAFGCRPGTSIRVRVTDSGMAVLPDKVATTGQMPNAPNTWEACRQWWKARGFNANQG